MSLVFKSLLKYSTFNRSIIFCCVYLRNLGDWQSHCWVLEVARIIALKTGTNCEWQLSFSCFTHFVVCCSWIKMPVSSSSIPMTIPTPGFERNLCSSSQSHGKIILYFVSNMSNFTLLLCWVDCGHKCINVFKPWDISNSNMKAFSLPHSPCDRNAETIGARTDCCALHEEWVCGSCAQWKYVSCKWKINDNIGTDLQLFA